MKGHLLTWCNVFAITLGCVEQEAVLKIDIMERDKDSTISFSLAAMARIKGVG